MLFWAGNVGIDKWWMYAFNYRDQWTNKKKSLRVEIKLPSLCAVICTGGGLFVSDCVDDDDDDGDGDGNEFVTIGSDGVGVGGDDCVIVFEFDRWLLADPDDVNDGDGDDDTAAAAAAAAANATLIAVPG